MEKYQSRKIKEYHKFFNVFAYKFRKFNKLELKFLANEILEIDIKDNHKAKILPILINEIYSVIIFKEENAKTFWQVVDYLSHFIKIVNQKSRTDSVFKQLNIKGIEIYHTKESPIYNEKHNKGHLTIFKNKKVCICEEKNNSIRKTHHCYNCENECHKNCLTWKKGNFICPTCILDFFDPLYSTKQKLFQPQILLNKHMYQFYLNKDVFKENNYLVIKCIKSNPQVNIKYNDSEINFPQKSIIKLNNLTIENFKPDKPNNPKRRDKTIILALSENVKNCLKKGLNLFYCEFDEEYEDNEHIKYIFNVYICEKLRSNTLINNEIQSQVKNYEKNKFKSLKKSFNECENSYKIKISLTDPILLKQIKIPVRGEKCTHLNFFCLESYLKNLENTEHRKLKCPFCSKLFLHFEIDFFMVKILFEYQSLLKSYNLEQEITFNQDFTYNFHEAPPLPTPQFSMVSNNKSIHDSNKTENNLDENSSDSENEDSDENFEITSMQRRLTPTSDKVVLFKRGRGRPPGSRNKTPEERIKQKMEIMMRQAQKMYSSSNIRHLTDEENKILESIRPYAKQNLNDRIILDSYYETLQLQKRIKNYVNYKKNGEIVN